MTFTLMYGTVDTVVHAQKLHNFVQEKATLELELWKEKRIDIQGEYFSGTS